LAAIPLEALEKLLDSWDSAVAMSRATLKRKISMILRELVSNPETPMTEERALSRASLGP
jgi:hypothetical protein